MSGAPLKVGRGGALPAELSLPLGSGPHPAIVPLHPASERSRDQRLFRHLAEILPPRGIAVLRYDRRGDDVPLDDQVEDALTAVELLAGRRDIDPKRIGLWGFSQGAWVAPLAAARSDRIAFLILLASTGVTPAEQMRYGVARHAAAAGYGDAVPEILRLRASYEEHLRGRVNRDAMQSLIDRASARPWFEHAYVRHRLEPDSAGWPDMDFDPAPRFSQVRVPTLLFYGEDDLWSPIDASVAAWRRAAEVSGNRDLTIVRLAGTGHAPTFGEDGPISPEYERAMVEWLADRTRVG